MGRDQALVKRILAGDAAAGERLVGDHYARVRQLLLHLTGSPELARDLTQQTFLEAWRALDSFAGRARLSTWLHRIAYRQYCRWLRGRRAEAPLEAAAAVGCAESEAALAGVPVRRALAQLPREQYELCLLYYVQGLSVAEVAAVLEVPVSTVKSRLCAARERLRGLLSDPKESPCHDLRARTCE